VSFSFALPQKIEEGDFLIRLRWRDREFYQLVSIENYEKPSFTVQLTPEKPVYAKGEEVRFSVKGEYYSKRPLSGVSFVIRYFATLLVMVEKNKKRKYGRKKRIS
jgi:uncharacterized protein YfaS (alpha-2-macroglobulin family)